MNSPVELPTGQDGCQPSAHACWLTWCHSYRGGGRCANAPGVLSGDGDPHGFAENADTRCQHVSIIVITSSGPVPAPPSAVSVAAACASVKAGDRPAAFPYGDCDDFTAPRHSRAEFMIFGEWPQFALTGHSLTGHSPWPVTPCPKALGSPFARMPTLFGAHRAWPKRSLRAA